MSDLDLFADLVTRKLVSSDGGAVTLPIFVLGDTLRCTLRTFERSEGGDLRERDLRVRTLRASIGRVLAPPAVGWFKLRIGDYDTSEINFDANADAFKTATQGSGIVDTVETPVTGTWVVKTTRPDPGGEWPINIHSNKLGPESFVRVRQFKQLGVWWFECRLIQAPLAFNNGHERVLPFPPTVRRVRTGDAGSETQPASNDIQALHLPPDFRGTYFLRWNYRVSKLLGIEDGPDEIAAALNAMFGKGKRFEATNPEPDHAYVEFVGALAGSPQQLITVEVNTFAPGVLTFTMPLDRASMAAALRGVPEIDLPFEVEAEIVEDGGDITDPAVPGRVMTLFQQTVKVVREQIWEELVLVQSIDWLRPPQPRDYIPFTPDQVIAGVQHYVAVFGNDELRSFAFPHNLGTEAFHLTVRENAPNGRVLVNGEAFTITIPSANETVLTFPDNETPPALNSLALVLSTAGPRSAFLSHTHTMAQIIGLQDALDLLNARLAAIEDLLPSIRPGAEREEADSFGIEIPDKAEIYPGRFAAASDPKALIGSARLKPGGLLPAVHDASIDPLLIPLTDPALHAGKVFQNNSELAVVIPGGLGRRSSILPPLGYAASDGRVWYRVTRDNGTNSFFPTDFERELFMLHINEQMLRPGGTFRVEFDVALQTLVATTRAHYLLLIEAGSAPSQTVPALTGTNLEDITWLPTPLLRQRLIISGLSLKHHFGCAIKRNIAGALTADQLLYNIWEAAPQAPASASFTLRARLAQFDTENSVAGAKGLVSYALTNAAAKIS